MNHIISSIVSSTLIPTTWRHFEQSILILLSWLDDYRYLCNTLRLSITSPSFHTSSVRNPEPNRSIICLGLGYRRSPDKRDTPNLIVTEYVGTESINGRSGDADGHTHRAYSMIVSLSLWIIVGRTPDETPSFRTGDRGSPSNRGFQFSWATGTVQSFKIQNVINGGRAVCFTAKLMYTMCVC